MATISVIGAGFVGLTTGIHLSELGHSVVISEIDGEKVRTLQLGKVPFDEDSLKDKVGKFSSIQFTSDNVAAASNCEFAFLCLPTPALASGAADISALEEVVEELRDKLRPNTVLIVKSTVPVGTTRRLEKRLKRPDCYVASNPEFLREGQALFDSRSPARIVIGCMDESIADKIFELYGHPNCPVVKTDFETAELIKYTSNAYLAMRLSFVNDIASISSLAGANTRLLFEGIGLDNRIGHQFLKPGPGWGGSCFPKDTQALIRTAQELGFEFHLLDAVVRSNERHQMRLTAQIKNLVEVRGSKIGVLGLTFKAGTSDQRKSPALRIACDLAEDGYTVVAYDPTCSTHSDLTIDAKVHIASNISEVCAGMDLLVVLTEWPEFSSIDPGEIAPQMRNAQVLDARGILNRTEWVKAGFEFFGLFNV